jgi:putative membrane protein
MSPSSSSTSDSDASPDEEAHASGADDASNGAPNDASAPDADPVPEPPSASNAESSGTASTTLGAVQEPQRLHPLTLALRIGASLPALFIILLPTFQNPSSENLVSVVLSVVYGLVALPAIVLQYLRFSYRITPKQIVIQKGVIQRQNRSIPIERIQNIQIQQNLVARLVGLAKVTIETAGSSATEGSLEYVSLSDAHEIRQMVRSFQHRTAENASGEVDDAPDAENEEKAPSETLFAMDLPRVLLSGAFRFSLLYIALVFSAVQFVDPEVIVQRVLRSQGRIDQVTETMAVHPGLTILGTVVVAGILGWVSGIAIHLTRYYRFQLWLDGDKLRKRHGLFTVTEGTIPLGKVQALILRTNPLMRLFGWYELEVQTIGMNVDEQGHRVIAPFAQYEDILALAQRVRSFDLPDTFGSVSRLTIRRRFFRYTLALSALLVPGVYAWPADWWHLGGAALPWWGFGLVPFILGWALLQYRNHGYAVRTDGLYIRRGVISHYLWILPTEKFHVFHATATIFQRRLGLKTMFVDTAGAATFAYPEVIDLPAAEADAQMDRLYQRFQALYRTRIEEATGAPDTRLDAADRPRLPVSSDGDAG